MGVAFSVLGIDYMDTFSNPLQQRGAVIEVHNQALKVKGTRLWNEKDLGSNSGCQLLDG